MKHTCMAYIENRLRASEYKWYCHDFEMIVRSGSEINLVINRTCNILYSCIPASLDRPSKEKNIC